MNISIIDACFPLSDRKSKGLAATWIQWQLEKNGVQTCDPYLADVLCVTCVDPRNYTVIKSLKKKYPDKKIYVGGAGALSPYSLGLYADAVCVGNGERFIDTLAKYGCDAVSKLPETWVNNEKRNVDVAGGFPWMCPPIQAEDGAYRLWCGKGCKKKCLFCHTGWSTKYEENPNPRAVVEAANTLLAKKKHVAYLSNDLMQHSFFASLPATQHGSYSLEYIRKNGLPPARQIRLGVEGVSERLRTFINKPIAHEDLIRATAWLNKNQKSVRWFMIAGLPGESDSDWDEIKDAIIQWKKICNKGVLALSFTAWQPEPSSPLGICPIEDSYWNRWENFREWFFGGRGWSNRIKLMQPANPKTRMLSAIARMGLTEAQLRIGGNWGPNDRVNYPYKKQRNLIAEKIRTLR